MASCNPSDEDLARLRDQGLSVAVSLLDAKAQPPRYDKKSATLAGWAIYSVPIEEGGAPSLDQLGRLVDWPPTRVARPRGLRGVAPRGWPDVGREQRGEGDNRLTSPGLRVSMCWRLFPAVSAGALRVTEAGEQG
jgi:hypothetical protein